MEHAARTRLLTAAVLAVVFGSGVLLGYAADSDLISPTPEVATAAEVDGESGEQTRTRKFVYEQMARTPEQDAAIDVIISSHRVLMNELHRDFGEAQAEYEANYDALVVEVREAIAETFEPARRAEYRQLLAEFDQRRDADRAARDARK